ncbi:MAG TPA: Ig-like domain-containing protein [Acidobacteriota bacterium]|nr:Ig-like domain-containing protein [Acidobacteriota bacterium]
MAWWIARGWNRLTSPLRTARYCLIAGLLVAVCDGCAQKGRPVGGPPDTTPPEVVASIPAAGATRVSREALVTIQFSEPIDRTTFLPNLFVSPPIGGSPEVKWSKGDQVVGLRWADSLRPDATYRMTIGASVHDRHKNGFAKAHTFAFSTGLQIDPGHIAGRVTAADQGIGSAPTFNVHAYDAAQVSDTFWLIEPDYVTQTGRVTETEIAGWFDLPYLKTGRYLLLAFADKNRNDRLDAGEPFGLPLHDPLITEAAPSDTVAVFTAVFDTVGFCLTDCAATPWGGLSLVFSQPVDTIDWGTGVFLVVDTATADTVGVSALRPAFRRPSMLALRSTGFVAGQSYQIIVSGLRDHRGRALCPDASCRVSFGPVADTIGPKVDWTHLPGMRKGVTPHDPVVLQFDEPVDTARAGMALTATDTAGAIIPAQMYWDDELTLRFTPDQAWPEKMTVRVELDSTRVYDLAGNRAPTQSFSWSFTPIAGSDMGSLEGRIAIGDPAAGTTTCRLTARQLEGTLAVTRMFAAPGGFAFDLPEGRWTLAGYLDINGDGHWFPGSLDPYAHPEPRTIHGDTLLVRSRFTLEDITVRF